VEQDVVRVATEAERHEAAAQLGFEERGHHRAEAHAAVLLRREDTEEPGLLGLVLQLLQLVPREARLARAFAAQHLRLQRDDLLAHEGPHPVADLLLLLVEREVHFFPFRRTR
jgi:hypothetical protein